ncbi:hypothetical protein Tco_0974900 [Tanacetum coccineum]|uniref:Reverse transcriptase domain-containing protein n=1 Tax=Tanacetum coccineum TaxID=301880 RepID=A0ABQ5ED56_9ASTR
MKGGIRIEGDEITIYKKVTKIKTSNQTEIAEIAELEQGYIREEPLKHWKKNGELCKLDIINPDITIEDRPLKHVMPAMEDLFRKHVDSLLKIGAIRPSKSRHRTMTMIVNSGTTIDPVTGREVKGKERMVFNFKSLNDNTYKDQYSLPGINTIIKIIGGAKIFSKFDLKLGFHQVAMDEESIPWTKFLVAAISSIGVVSGHFAKDCRSKQGNITRSAVYQELDLDDNWDIVSADFDNSNVYSISEGECDTHQSISVMVHDTPFKETVFMAIEKMISWKPNKELPVKSKECEHEWNENTVTNYTICYYCGILTTDMSRLNCPKCQLTTCALCTRNYLGKTVNVKRKQPQKSEEEKDFNSNEVKLLKELLKEKTKQVQQMIRDQAKEYYENKAAIQKKEEIWHSKESLLIRDLTDALKIIDQLRIEKERLEEQKDEEIRELKAQLQKKEEEAEVQFSREEFPPLRNTHIARPCIETEVHYSGNATTNTGASACCINKKVIPREALEPLTQMVFFNGLNSKQQATHKIKQGYFLIEGNKFKIPLIYAFDIRDSNEIAEIAELEVSEEEFLEINESIYFNQEGSRAFQEQFKPVIDRLKQQGYIGEEPL